MRVCIAGFRPRLSVCRSTRSGYARVDFTVNVTPDSVVTITLNGAAVPTNTNLTSVIESVLASSVRPTLRMVSKVDTLSTRILKFLLAGILNKCSEIPLITKDNARDTDNVSVVVDTGAISVFSTEIYPPPNCTSDNASMSVCKAFRARIPNVATDSAVTVTPYARRTLVVSSVDEIVFIVKPSAYNPDSRSVLTDNALISVDRIFNTFSDIKVAEIPFIVIDKDFAAIRLSVILEVASTCKVNSTGAVAVPDVITEDTAFISVDKGRATGSCGNTDEALFIIVLNGVLAPALIIIEEISLIRLSSFRAAISVSVIVEAVIISDINPRITVRVYPPSPKIKLPNSSIPSIPDGRIAERLSICVCNKTVPQDFGRISTVDKPLICVASALVTGKETVVSDRVLITVAKADRATKLVVVPDSAFIFIFNARSAANAV